MNIFKLLFQLGMLYLLYKLIFDFIIPVYRTTKQMKGKMNEMQEHFRQQQAAGQQQAPKHEAQKPRVPADDYIEFEEIK